MGFQLKRSLRVRKSAGDHSALPGQNQAAPSSTQGSTSHSGGDGHKSTSTEQTEKYGITVCSDGSNPIVDIVFVHGLTGDSFNTWLNAGPPPVYWPKDLLSKDLVNARALTFGYDADIVDFWGPASKNRIADHAGNLLGELVRLRERTDSEDRKIILIAHSLGGLVAQQSLWLSWISAEKCIRPIEKCTVGFVFWGTPHHGSNLEAWIVSRHSATIAGYESYGIQADDTSMAKYSRSQDLGYDVVLTTIQRWMRSLVQPRTKISSTGEVLWLSQVVALTGTEENTQAATCGEYVHKVWPDTGPLLIAYLDGSLHGYLADYSAQPSVVFEGRPFSQIEIFFNGDTNSKDTADIKTTVVVQRFLQFQAEVAEILAWLTAAFHSGQKVGLSRSKAKFESQSHSSKRMDTHFILRPEALEPILEGVNMCWFPLFENSVIAVQFPYANRTQGVGVELSPLLMATLAGVITAVEVRGGLILRGLSTALIPLVEVEGDAIQWYLVTSDLADGEFNTDLFGELTEGGFDSEYYKVQDIQTLWRKKAYLGWCKVATVLMGTKEADYHKVTWSDQSEIHRTVEFTGFSLGLGSVGLGMAGPSMGADFAISKKNATRFIDIKQQLGHRLRFSIVKPILVYDTLDRCGWMIPIACLLLHMMHLRLRELSKSLDALENDSANMPYSTASGEGGRRQAYEILTKYMSQNVTSALGSSEVWEATQAQLYIALDTFLSETRTLQRDSFPAQYSEICGFEFMDAVRAENPFRYSRRKIEKNPADGRRLQTWWDMFSFVEVLVTS